jgi:hypothetical protein
MSQGKSWLLERAEAYQEAHPDRRFKIVRREDLDSIPRSPIPAMAALLGWDEEVMMRLNYLNQAYLFPAMTPEAIESRNAAAAAKIAAIAREEQERQAARASRLQDRTGRRKASRMARRGY